MCNFNKGYLFLVLGLLVPAIILVIACGPSAPASTEPAGGSAAVSESVSNGTAQESVVAVNFSGKQLTPETIQVKQDENVTLNLETDRPGSFHIHGYDLEKEAAVGEVTEFQFVANATGRFRITFHGAASPEPAMTGTEGMKGETPMAGMDRTSGEHDMSSVSGGSVASGSMDHGPVESAAPVSVDISATVVDRGNCSNLVGRMGRRPFSSHQSERQQRGFAPDFRTSNPRIPLSLNSYGSRCPCENRHGSLALGAGRGELR